MDALSWPEVKPELKGPYPKVSRAFRPYARAFKILRRRGLVEFMVDDSPRKSGGVLGGSVNAAAKGKSPVQCMPCCIVCIGPAKNWDFLGRKNLLCL